MLDIQSIREKLRKLKCKNLCEMVMKQRKSKCLLNGYCPLHFRYEGFTFCVSEVLGKGCEVQRLEKLEKEICQPNQETDIVLPLFPFDKQQERPSETFLSEK